MAVKIRLTRIGKRDDPKYRIIVCDERVKRDGKFIERLGFYDPIIKPHKLEIKEDRLNYWIGQGAQLSDGLRRLLKKK